MGWSSQQPCIKAHAEYVKGRSCIILPERFIVVDVKYSKTLARPVGLDEIKADPRFAGWDLLRISRLSIVPVPKNIWTILIELSKSK